MFTTALTFVRMATGNTRLTIDVPDDIHEAFKVKCFLAKPRTNMKDRLVAFMAAETGKPVPKFVDRRKLTREQREKLDGPADKSARR